MQVINVIVLSQRLLERKVIEWISRALIQPMRLMARNEAAHCIHIHTYKYNSFLIMRTALDISAHSKSYFIPRLSDSCTYYIDDRKICNCHFRLTAIALYCYVTL